VDGHFFLGDDCVVVGLLLLLLLLLSEGDAGGGGGGGGVEVRLLSSLMISWEQGRLPSSSSPVAYGIEATRAVAAVCGGGSDGGCCCCSFFSVAFLVVIVSREQVYAGVRCGLCLVD